MRVAWVMKLKPGSETEYKKRHDEIWPEVTAMQRREGIRNYSIYRHGLTLFAYMERDTPLEVGKPPPDSVVWQWWAMMAPLMEVNPDNSPVTEPVELMFYFPGKF
jgi:L-rhamnose mutarotase